MIQQSNYLISGHTKSIDIGEKILLFVQPVQVMRLLIFAFFLLFGCQKSSPKVVNVEFPATGEIHLTEGISIPKIQAGYTLWLPASGKANGLVVFTHPRRDTIESDFLIEYATNKQLAVLYASTENRLEFFFEASRMEEILGYIQEVMDTHQIPKEKLLFAGMSLEGTRALKLAIYGQSETSDHQLKPAAIAICDAPLDMVRFHREARRAERLNIHPSAANEGKWVAGYLEKNLGGTPKDTLRAYLQYSPFCYQEDSMYLSYFEGISIRAYTEPDVQWWMETRGKDFYGMNSIDLAAWVNALRNNGNKNATLITTENKGYHPDGARHPHSWSIVDEKELVDWFIKQLQE